MEQNTAGRQQPTTSNGAEPRKHQNKSVRVTFGPDLNTYIPPRDESPAPSQGHHHRSFTLQTVPSQQVRPTSSSAGENPVAVTDSSPNVTSDRAADSGRPATLKRAKSDYGPRLGVDKATTGDDEEDFAMRHGWQEEYTSSEYLKILHSVSTAKSPLQCQRERAGNLIFAELLHVLHREAP